jgi:4-aminobutyrate aminotransferase-like enzyme
MLPVESHSGKELRNEIIDLQRKYVVPCVEAWHDILFVKGNGSKLYDSEGKEYVDCFGGVAVVNIGHCHPKVIQAVEKQLRELTHLSTLYYTEAMPRLAENLSKIAPMDGEKAKKSFFCNSGTEANEHAITLAKKATGRNEVLSLQCGFYGRGGTTAGLTGLGAWRTGLGPFTPGIYHAPSYYCYRCPMGYKNGPPDCNWACANYIQHMLKTETTKNVAAFIAEPVLGVGGCIPAPKEYFKVIKEILLKENILLVVDEVQSGNGRTGKFFGIENYGVEPDVITIAKGLGGGLLPIGAVISKSEIADKHLGPDFSTFGGNPLSCVAAIANLKVIKEENLEGNATRVGDYMIKRLKEIERGSKILDGVEGLGLMIGMEIVVDKENKSPATNDTLTRIMNEMASEGVLVGRGGLYYNRIRMEPPLCITLEEADRVLDVFEEAIKMHQRSGQ